MGMNKTEISGIKAVGINFEHIEIGPVDLGIKGKQNFISLIVLGVVFYLLSILPLGGLTQWFTIFYLLSFVGAVYLFAKLINPRYDR